MSMPKPVKFDHIVKAVCVVCKVTRGDLQSHTRLVRICTSRHLMFYLAREMTKLSLTSLGLRMGGRDHTTVRSAAIRADHMIRICPEFKLQYRRAKFMAWLFAQVEQPQMLVLARPAARKERQSYKPQVSKNISAHEQAGPYVMPEREGSTLAIPLNRQRSLRSGSSNYWVGGAPEERKSA